MCGCLYISRTKPLAFRFSGDFMVFVNPLIEVALVATALFVLFQFLREKFIDQEAQELLKIKQKEWKEHLKNNNKKKAEETQRELMELNFKVMRGTMPLMLVSFATLIFVIWPLNGVYTDKVFPIAMHVPLPLLNKTPSWIWYLFIVNIVLTVSFMIAKRILKKRSEEKK